MKYKRTSKPTTLKCQRKTPKPITCSFQMSETSKPRPGRPHRVSTSKLQTSLCQNLKYQNSQAVTVSLTDRTTRPQPTPTSVCSSPGTGVPRATTGRRMWSLDSKLEHIDTWNLCMYVYLYIYIYIIIYIYIYIYIYMYIYIYIYIYSFVQILTSKIL